MKYRNLLMLCDVTFPLEQLVVHTFTKLCHAVRIEGSGMSPVSIRVPSQNTEDEAAAYRRGKFID
jgi:hypothetical protein